MKKGIVAVICVVFALIIAGCSVTGIKPTDSGTQKEDKVLLTKRQIFILKEMGLSTNYEDLTNSQKSSIEAIEDIFCYLDKKYPNDEFTYSGYVSGKNPMDAEHLIVYSDYGEVTVYRTVTNNGCEYNDNFEERKLGGTLEKKLTGCVQTVVANDSFKLFAEVKKITDDDLNEDNILSKVWGAASIYVNETVGTDVFDKMIEIVEAEVKQEALGNAHTISFAFVKEDQFDKIAYYNYTEMNSEDVLIKRITYSLSKDGKEYRY